MPPLLSRLHRSRPLDWPPESDHTQHRFTARPPGVQWGRDQTEWLPSRLLSSSGLASRRLVFPHLAQRVTEALKPATRDEGSRWARCRLTAAGAAARDAGSTGSAAALTLACCTALHQRGALAMPCELLAAPQRLPHLPAKPYEAAAGCCRRTTSDGLCEHAQEPGIAQDGGILQPGRGGAGVQQRCRGRLAALHLGCEWGMAAPGCLLREARNHMFWFAAALRL